MKKIIVQHKIGDIVEHSFNEMKFKVIGYNIIGDSIQYICSQTEKPELLYLYPSELKHFKDITIGFISKK